MDKIEKLFALLPDNLSEANKNGIIEFIKEGIGEAQKEWEDRLTSKDTAIAEAEKTIENLKASAEEAKTQMSALSDEVKALKEEAAARAREAKFQERMAMIDDEFELSEAEKERIVKKCRDLDDDQFTDWYEDFSTFAQSKKKSVIEAAKNDRDEEISSLQAKLAELEKGSDKTDEEETETSEASASTESTEGDGARATEDALDNLTEEANQSVAQAQTPSDYEPTFEDRLKAFRDSVEIKI